MKYINVRCNDKIQLGKRGEYEAVTVQFDISEWRKLYGDGVVRMIVQRSEDEVPYDKDISVDGSVVSWLVDAVDTSVTGWGQAELLYYVGNTLAKSQTYKFHVIESLGDETGETPDPWESMVDRVEGYAARAESARDRAVTAESNAVSSETNAFASEVNARLSEQNSKESEVNAKESETNAEYYAEKAEQVATSNGYATFEFDDDGNLYLIRTANIVDKLDFELTHNGELEAVIYG